MKNEIKRIKREVKKLAKEKKYEEIYQQYGPKYFRKYVSEQYKEKDIEKLREEGKYIDIYTKYGRLDLESKIRLSKAERDKTLPVKNGSIARFIGYTKISIASFLSAVSTSYAVTQLDGPIYTQIAINNNKEQYESQIQEYNEKIKEYAEKFDITKQSDLEIIMRCMYDLHNTIEGYGTPKLDLAGYRGLDVINEGGIGVCRNFAPNIADKLNEINPEYNARIVTIYSNSSKFIPNNITKTIICDNGDKIVQKANEKEIYENDILVQKEITTDDNIVKIYYNESGETIKEEIINENEKIEITYEEGKKIEKRSKGNENLEIIYDEKGNVEKETRTIKEEKNGVSYYKEIVNGKLKYLNEKTEYNYKYVIYDDEGNVSCESIADSEKEVTKNFRNGQLYLISTLESGYETKVRYDEQGNEISCETEKTDRENSYISDKRFYGKLDEYKETINILEQYEKVKKESMVNGKIANHEIVAVDIDSDNITLLIDPFMLGLGIYKNGEIIMFNEQKKEESQYIKSNIINEATIDGMEKFIEYPANYIKSFKEPTLSMEELEDKYGIVAQNKMLEKIEKEETKSMFKETLKVNDIDKVNVSYNFEKNIAYMDNRKTENEIEEEQELK